MTCENCGAPTRLARDRGVFVCEYCASEFIPRAGEDGVQVLGDTKFKCPACDGVLSDGQVETHPLLYCTRCRGMLIGMDEFVPLLETLRAFRDHPEVTLSPRDSVQGSPRVCPRCSQPMDQHPYGGPGNVIIDTCESCAVNWLDKGELQRMVAAPDYTYNLPSQTHRSINEAP